MSTDTREARLARRISDLYATDQQFADARPSETVATAIESSELRLPLVPGPNPITISGADADVLWNSARA